MCDRVVFRRILCNSGNNCALGKSQFGYILAEILIAGRLYTVAAGPQIDDIQIIFQDLILVQHLFQLYGQVLFLNFAVQALLEGTFTGPVRENGIFQQLLGDGACPFGKASGFQTGPGSPDNSPHIDPVVLVKTRIFNGYERMLQIRRNFVDGYQIPVGFRKCQFERFISFRIIDIGGRFGRCDGDLTDIGGILNGLADIEDSDNTSADDHSQQNQKDDF